MNCPMSSCLYVKANGEIPCWCGSGEKKILYHAAAETDIVNSVLLGQNYDHIRTSLSRDLLPWPVLCSLCVFLDRKSPFVNKIVGERRIDSIQMEPSFLCQLDCFACYPPKKDRKKVKAPPYNMPMDLFRKLIDDLYGAEFSVGLFDLQGRGEPLMNDDVWKMVAYTRRHFPESNIEITTNGNFEYNESSVHSGLSKLVVSVDGCFQDSYAKYRKGGNIDVVYRFMERFANDKTRYGRDTELIWKYILFNHNENDSELIEAQKKALKIGVDELMFHVTPLVHNCKRSKYFKKNELANFPRIDTGASSLKILYPDENNPANQFMKKFFKRKLAIFAWWIIKSILLRGKK